MDPFIANALLMLGLIVLLTPIGLWLLPKADRAVDRIEAWLDARKARRSS